jgi:hypothetical protein
MNHPKEETKTMDEEMDSALITTGIWDVVKQANGGDYDALSVVETMLSGPEASEMLAAVGDLSSQALEATLRNGLGTSQDGTKTIVRAKLSAMRNDLGWAKASDLERLAIDRVVHGWLAVHYAEIRLAQCDEGSLSFAKYLDDRLCKAEKRYSGSLRTLASLRRDQGSQQVRVEVSTTLATR